MGKVKEITDKNIKDFIQSPLCLLQFSADWCGPCRMVGPIIDELATNNEDIQVGKVNIGSNKESAARYGIRSIPTIIFFKDGIKVEQVSGAVPLNKLQEIVNGLK